MAIRIEKRLQTNAKNTISDIDPIRDAGNDIPSFVLERFSSSFIKILDDLREFISIYFSLQADMNFYRDINDNSDKKSVIIDSYYNKYNKIYLNKCSLQIKQMLDKLYLLDYYQINSIFFIVASNNLFCLAVFKTTCLKSLTEKITGQMVIYKYGNDMQKLKYLKNDYNFFFLIEENNSCMDNILSTSTSIQTNEKALNSEIILKGHKKNVGIDFKAFSINVLLIFVKDLNKNKTFSLKQSFDFIIVDMNNTFENKIQKIKCYSTLTMNFYQFKFNSILLETSSTFRLSQNKIYSLEILEYQMYIKQMLFNSGILSQSQQLMNYVLHEADENYTVLLSPPKATKLIKADHFKSNIGHLFLELRQQILYNFATCSDLEVFTNKNINFNFAIAKVSVPQKCNQIFDWAFSILKSDVYLSENCKFLQFKNMLSRYQVEDSSSENLTYKIGKEKVTGFLRIKRGLSACKTKLKQQECCSEEKENSINTLNLKNKDDVPYSAGVKSVASEILSSRGSLLSTENSVSFSRRPLTPGNNMY